MPCFNQFLKNHNWKGIVMNERIQRKIKRFEKISIVSTTITTVGAVVFFILGMFNIVDMEIVIRILIGLGVMYVLVSYFPGPYMLDKLRQR